MAKFFKFPLAVCRPGQVKFRCTYLPPCSSSLNARPRHFASLAWSAVFALGECMCPDQHSKSWQYELAVERLTWNEPNAFSLRSGWRQLEKGPDSNCLQFSGCPGQPYWTDSCGRKLTPPARLLNVPCCKFRGQGLQGQRNVPRGRRPGQGPHKKVWKKFYEDSRTSLDVLCKSRECNTFWT